MAVRKLDPSRWREKSRRHLLNRWCVGRAVVARIVIIDAEMRVGGALDGS